MAQHKSAIKRFKQSLRRRAANKSYRSTVKTAIKQAYANLGPEGSLGPEKRHAVHQAISLIAKASRKGLIHPNASRRKISKLMKAVSRLDENHPSTPSSTTAP